MRSSKQLAAFVLIHVTAGFIATGQHHHHQQQQQAPPEEEEEEEGVVIYRSRGRREISAEQGRSSKAEEAGPNSISQDSEELNKIPHILFLSPNYTVVQAQTRTTAILHCEVTDIGNNTITWKRRRDYQILTFGLWTYSSDSRFFTRVGKGGKDWSLHIKHVQPPDEGLYECQVSSHPPSSVFVDLQLVEAHAEIIGGPDKIVKSGSPLLLSCVLRHSTEEPVFIFWYHGDRMINFDVGGGARVRHGRQGSELLIPKAEVQHAGNYSCVPSNVHPVSVNVHVLHSEKPAAMQHGSKNSSPPKPHPKLCHFTLAFAFFLLLRR